MTNIQNIKILKVINLANNSLIDVFKMDFLIDNSKITIFIILIGDENANVNSNLHF